MSLNESREPVRGNREKFVELAEKRVQKALDAIKLIGNLANKTNYSYGTEDTNKIFRALRREIDIVRKKFETTSTEAEKVFKL